MLTLTYTEAGLHMERVSISLEVSIAQRVLLAVRTGHKLYVEPGNAAFLFPADAPGLPPLEAAIERNQPLILTPVDDTFVEISLQGSWLAESAATHEGIFLTALSDRAEFFVYKLWQITQLQVSSWA